MKLIASFSRKVEIPVSVQNSFFTLIKRKEEHDYELPVLAYPAGHVSNGFL